MYEEPIVDMGGNKWCEFKKRKLDAFMALWWRHEEENIRVEMQMRRGEFWLRIFSCQQNGHRRQACVCTYVLSALMGDYVYVFNPVPAL